MKTLLNKREDHSVYSFVKFTFLSPPSSSSCLLPCLVHNPVSCSSKLSILFNASSSTNLLTFPFYRLVACPVWYNIQSPALQSSPTSLRPFLVHYSVSCTVQFTIQSPALPGHFPVSCSIPYPVSCPAQFTNQFPAPFPKHLALLYSDSTPPSSRPESQVGSSTIEEK